MVKSCTDTPAPATMGCSTSSMSSTSRPAAQSCACGWVPVAGAGCSVGDCRAVGVGAAPAAFSPTAASAPALLGAAAAQPLPPPAAGSAPPGPLAVPLLAAGRAGGRVVAGAGGRVPVAGAVACSSCSCSWEGCAAGAGVVACPCPCPAVACASCSRRAGRPWGLATHCRTKACRPAVLQDVHRAASASSASSARRSCGKLGFKVLVVSARKGGGPGQGIVGRR